MISYNIMLKSVSIMLFVDNLLLTKNNDHVKVADLGLARENLCDLMTSEIGTYRYMAPEVNILIY
jgi:serine/threonine protein kinase